MLRQNGYYWIKCFNGLDLELGLKTCIGYTNEGKWFLLGSRNICFGFQEGERFEVLGRVIEGEWKND